MPFNSLWAAMPLAGKLSGIIHSVPQFPLIHFIHMLRQMIKLRKTFKIGRVVICRVFIYVVHVPSRRNIPVKMLINLDMKSLNTSGILLFTFVKMIFFTRKDLKWQPVVSGFNYFHSFIFSI